MSASGYKNIKIDEVKTTLATSDTLEQNANLLMKVGFGARVIRDLNLDEAQISQIRDQYINHARERQKDGMISYDALIYLVSGKSVNVYCDENSLKQKRESMLLTAHLRREEEQDAMNFVDFIRKNVSWILAGGVLSFMSSYGQTFFISIFGGKIRDDFGLSHAEWGSIYAIGTGVSAIVMVWAGVLTDILRTRVLGAIVLIGLAVACGRNGLYISCLSFTVCDFCLTFFWARDVLASGRRCYVALVCLQSGQGAVLGRAWGFRKGSLSAHVFCFCYGLLALAIPLACSGWRLPFGDTCLAASVAQ